MTASKIVHVIITESPRKPRQHRRRTAHLMNPDGSLGQQIVFPSKATELRACLVLHHQHGHCGRVAFYRAGEEAPYLLMRSTTFISQYGATRLSMEPTEMFDAEVFDTFEQSMNTRTILLGSDGVVASYHA